MRIHQLTIEAFGPFGAAEKIDFDALGSHGLFLMHGPTGSGKTSVLDAICFALFGQVPGARRSHTDRLRSDHAGPGAEPRVRMEFTVAGRRFRIDRRPAHLAPKKRGNGTTRRQAAVVLEERTDLGWRALSTRLDEAGDVIGEVVGLGLEQFAQVVLLPQGEFAAFLRAKADDRAALLERLFDISRFADVEDWLADHRRTLRARVQEAETSARTALVRAEESLADHAPQIERWRTLPIDDLPAEVAGAAAALSVDLTAAMAADDRARTATATARQNRDAAVAHVALLRELADARTVWQHHLDTAQQRDATARVLAQHDAATRVWPTVAVFDRAVEECRRRASVADAAHTALCAALGLADDALPGDLDDRLSAGDDTLRAVPGLLDQLAGQQRRVPDVEAQLKEAQRAVTGEQQTLDALDARLVELEQERAAAQQLAEGAPEAEERVRLLEAHRDCSERLRRLRTAAEEACAELSGRVERFGVAEREVLRLRRARLEGMAAELALDLSTGDPCPVCGSPDHPRPATSTAPVTADDIEAAEGVAAAARAEEVAARADLTTAAARVQETMAERDRVVARWLGDDPLTDDTGPDLLTRATADLATARGGAEHLTRILAEIGRRTADRTDAQRAHHDRVRTAERTAQTLDDLRVAIRDGRERLMAALAAHDDHCACVAPTADMPADSPGSPAAVLARHDQIRRLAATAARTSEDQSAAQHSRDSAENELRVQLEVEGFRGRDAAGRARLPRTDADRLRSGLHEADRVAQRARGVLDRPGVDAALATPAPDVAALTEVLAAAETDERAAHAAYESLRRAQRSIERLAVDLATVVEASRNDRTRMPAVDRIADLVAGGTDNALRMRLSSYVLAARLEEVTDLANETLAVMTDGRYRLQHTDERAKGGSRSGLGLQVHDAWTGTTRDTASLSGGESFMASLALALGLGRAVLHAAGGRPLETLLVDEGFGSLDDESLELVMQVLDDLRAGGRTVGIVSHVGELRGRVPAQIEVQKTEQGSSLRVHLGGASPAA